MYHSVERSGEDAEDRKRNTGPRHNAFYYEAVPRGSVSSVTPHEENSFRRRKKWIMPERFDGTSSLATFLGQFETCSRYNEWSDEDKLAYLCTSLKGTAAMILVTDREQCNSYDRLVQKLTQRYGNEGQVTLFRTQLRTRRRGKDESLQMLYMDISRLAALAYPGARTEHFEAIMVDAFLEALQDCDLEQRVRDREPKTLDDAYKAAMMLEANARGVRRHRRDERESNE